jgi:hypothetical protein
MIAYLLLNQSHRAAYNAQFWHPRILQLARHLKVLRILEDDAKHHIKTPIITSANSIRLE